MIEINRDYLPVEFHYARFAALNATAVFVCVGQPAVKLSAARSYAKKIDSATELLYIC